MWGKTLEGWVWGVFQHDINRGLIDEQEAHKRMAYAKKYDRLQSEADRQDFSDQPFYSTNIYEAEDYRSFRA
jgi:hypothetical protein